MALINQQIKNINPQAGLVGFANPTLYDIGLTSGSDNNLYQACFNDIADGVSNANGFGSGFKSVAGYDLCTGLGSPKPGLIYQLSSPAPLTPNQPLALLRFVIKTGDDNLGGGEHGSDATVDVLLADGTSYNRTLPASAPSRIGIIGPRTPSTSISRARSAPVTQSNPIAGVRINLVQNNPDWSRRQLGHRHALRQRLQPAVQRGDVGLSAKPRRHRESSGWQHGADQAEQACRQQRQRAQLAGLLDRAGLGLPVTHIRRPARPSRSLT